MKYNLRELTPKEMMCVVGACPAIFELERVTPKVMQCGIGTCPEIYKTPEDIYLIIGEQVDPKDAGLVGKVGDGETLISVPKKLIDEKKE